MDVNKYCLILFMRALTTLENYLAGATKVIHIDFPWPPKT